MSNPPTVTAMTSKGALLIDDNSKPIEGAGIPVNITGQGTTLVKTGAGILQRIIFNKPVATATVEYDDALTNTNPMGKITVPASPQPVTIEIRARFATGLSVTTGVADEDITVVYI